ncbi:MAG: hypothetical protein V3U67_01160 [Gemmatimonadota bacterium]
MSDLVNSNLLGRELLDDLNDNVAPRDPLERMMLQQLAWCHVRILRLSMDSSTVNGRALAVHELCDKAMNSFRRGMLALREYRGAAARSPHIAIQQLNQAEEQQVILATDGLAGKNATNELGANHGKRTTDRSKPPESKALEKTHPRRLEAASANGASEEALAQVNRTSNGRRKTPVKRERSQARRPVRRSRSS